MRIKKLNDMPEARWIGVRVTIDGEGFNDMVLAHGNEDALERAHWNWEEAEKIELYSEYFQKFRRRIRGL